MNGLILILSEYPLTGAAWGKNLPPPPLPLSVAKEVGICIGLKKLILLPHVIGCDWEVGGYVAYPKDREKA